MPRTWVPAPSADGSAAAATPLPGGTNHINLADDLSKNGSFVNKPVRGWLHPDQQIADNGICYGVRYIGCLEVNTSMKSLDFDTRSLIAKECINKVCESAGLKTADKKKKMDKRLTRMLSDKPNMDFAGSNVSLTITSSFLNLTVMETGEVIANHEMPNISFASGGDADTLDFVSYVAKDQRYGRACFVLECGGGLAQDVITTIGQAFELRFKQFLKRTPSVRNEAEMIQTSVHNGNMISLREDPEYYNDLPGKVPPEASVTASNVPENSAVSNECQTDNANVTKQPNQILPSLPVAYASSPLQLDVSESLIDLATDLPTVCSYKRPEPEYVNTMVLTSPERQAETNSGKQPTVKHDIFDMQPFSNSLSSIQSEEVISSSHQSTLTKSSTMATNPSSVSDANSPTTIDETQRAALMEEGWFHGPISRKESESLVVRDGDFLVRESQGCPGQYVLTGMQGGCRKHLLLVDPEGVVRTKDQVFDSISHLIKYHRDNCLPIISAESALILRTPVCRLRPGGKPIQV